MSFQRFYTLIITIVNIRVNRTYYHAFFHVNILHIVKICRRKCYGRKSIASAGFYTYRYLVAQLISDSAYL